MSIYRPRPSLSALGRQFWWYGRWKARVVERHPRSLKARHLVAPAATVGLALAPLLMRRTAGVGGWSAPPPRPTRCSTVAAVRRAEPTRHDADPMVLAACFPVMHLSWGAGFVTSLVEDGLRKMAR